MGPFGQGPFLFGRTGAAGAPTPNRPQTRRPDASQIQRDMMIAFLVLDLNRIAHSSRDYPWPEPGGCGRCHHPKLWGHGFVRMIFDGFGQALQMRRYRCPKCGCIVRVRPSGYLPRHQSPVATIRAALSCRIRTGQRRYPPRMSVNSKPSTSLCCSNKPCSTPS